MSCSPCSICIKHSRSRASIEDKNPEESEHNGRTFVSGNSNQGAESYSSSDMADPSQALGVIIEFEGPEDPSRPMNWKRSKKVFTCFLYGLLNMGATWATSSYSVAIPAIANEFDVPGVVSALGTTLFLFGFGIGPLLWAPLSEVFGRKIPAIAPSFVGMAFTFGIATSKDFQTILVTRFFAGFFSSAPITNSGGVLTDLFPPQQRGSALAGYSIAVAAGPLIAPVVGSAMMINGLRWQWVEYITGILMLVGIVLAAIFVDESDPEMILTYKARRLRVQTGNWALHAKHEEWELSIRELARKYLMVPLQLTFNPICFLMGLYASFVYAILYLTFSAFPIVFIERRRWNPFIGSLPYLSTLVGSLIGMVINVANNNFYTRRTIANHGKPVPEARLPPMMLGGIAFAAGLFLFGWTADPRVHWIGPVFGAGLIGLGFLTVFQAALNYLIDTFLKNAAFALASNTVVRCVGAGAFPLLAQPMFHGLGIDWASSLLAFVAVTMIPIPFLFYVYGRQIRAAGRLSRPSSE